jgi:hypothetical protein
MSHFIAGFATPPTIPEEFRDSLIEVAPSEIRQNNLKIVEKKAFLLTFGSDKAISDLIIHDRSSSSWLAVLGTPLFPALAEHEKKSLLDRFFKDPAETIIKEMDGCFAVLAHNGLTGSSYVATDYDNTTPIFYAKSSNGVFISSHELPLARFLHSEIDPLGFSMTVHLRLTWGQHTRFKGIQKLLPCQILLFRGLNEEASDIYWRPSEENQWPSRFEYVLAEWLPILENSVRSFHECSRNKTIISDFTAGEDARLILAQCHALGIPFVANVNGRETDIDVIIAREAAQKAGFDLIVQGKRPLTRDQLLNNATYISLMNDAYEDYFFSCILYAFNAAYPPKHYDYVKLCGAPGGEVFRGSYYMRGKAFLPQRRKGFDYRFFTKMKYLLDFHPGLMRFSDAKCKEVIFGLVKESLEDVSEFPVGIKIDHMLRVFQTCNDGLVYKNPRYLPFATKHMTRSIYRIPPRFKRGGRLTKACTEILFPKLAFIKTQKGVPTIRRTLPRTPLFMPEYLSAARGIMSGAVSRLWKWADSNKPSYKWSENAATIETLLKEPPYGEWFSSPDAMVTGHLYSGALESLLSEARGGSSRYVPILGRVISQELACRWVLGAR